MLLVLKLWFFSLKLLALIGCRINSSVVQRATSRVWLPLCFQLVHPHKDLILHTPVLQKEKPFRRSSWPNISQHQVFSNESVLGIMWPNYWSFNFSISPYNEYSGLISFRIDWLELLAAQGTLKSPLQHHSSKASTLWWSALSPTLTSTHDYWKNHSLE